MGVSGSLFHAPGAGCQSYRCLECKNQKIFEIRPFRSFQTFSRDHLVVQATASKSINRRGETEFAPFGKQGPGIPTVGAGTASEMTRWRLGDLGWASQAYAKSTSCSIEATVQRG